MKQYVIIFLISTLSLMAKCSFNTSTFTAKEGEVIDTKSKLIWKRCSFGEEWQKGKGCVGEIKLIRRKEAEAYARSLGNGWRVPSVDELLSLVDERCKTPVINSALFGKLHDTGEGANYLTSSVYLEGDDVIPTLFYTIDFMNGVVDAHTKSYSGAVRLVR
ncbi:DUF1566 domain-containing protein [Sulfurospirillum halorespirans]|uniref:Lcl C-terminal domain-containing protein n=1 Tax=Sulfurospirillum halorespirans DSM 13726 TaxID=1193502 RepID=A0A1D7TLG8_9BACT|nr:DUF1566 domain-containing protein [Sulfurospirillum halorespirans]AOO65832.1 hypothetical protein SHALO_2061 [Sulfurospirillum halorespirans DSM 13726]